MKSGLLRLESRTVKGLYYAAGGCTLFALGVGLFLLVGMMFLPEAKDFPLR